MKKIFLGLAILSAYGVASVQAEPTIAANGVIQFTGSVTADSCVVHSNGPGSTGSTTLNYDMGRVPVSALGTEANPATSEGTLTALPTNLNLEIECESAASVELELIPTTTSGKGIATVGTAENVQIMLVHQGESLDFTNGSAQINANMIGNSASIPLRAYYTLAAGVEASEAKPGSADATVNYVLSYN